MFWNKKQDATKTESLPGPRKISGEIEKHLVAEYKWEPEMVALINMVVRGSARAEKSFDFRVFDPSEAEAIDFKVKDYTSLDAQPALILYQGWWDEGSRQVELIEKKKISYNVPLSTKEEIEQKIEAMHEPGSSVFFYQARGPSSGGPLGRGAAVIELNPAYPGKGQKKYNIYTANVVGAEPNGHKQKLFNSDKPKEIAKWVIEAHHKRMY